MTQLAGKLLDGATQRCGTPKTAAACVKGKQALGAQLCAQLGHHHQPAKSDIAA
jgi:hypothetical protein